MTAARVLRDAGDVAAAAQLACLLEASAFKPGNVSPGRPFADTTYEHFLASAVAIGPPIARSGSTPLGRTIRACVEATACWAPRNTNLGIVLLLVPLARAAIRGAEALRLDLARVLAATTVEDAREAYAAIRLAAPGGLSRSAAQDVRDTPTVVLREAMALAAERDAIAREWTTDFELTFELAVPALAAARADGLSWSDATGECHLTLLAHEPDTHIARKVGLVEAERVTELARGALRAGGVRTDRGRDALRALDGELRDPRNARNPGSSADLTAAAIFVTLLEGGWA